MTPEAQRIAIAEACGWRFVGDDPKYKPYWTPPTGHRYSGRTFDAGAAPVFFPKYLTDLNAMHEAEKVLNEDQRHDFMLFLEDVSLENNAVIPLVEVFKLVHTTAAQRAEAFLRTLNLWRDNQ